MLRLTDIKLPLEHAEADLAAAIRARIDIASNELTTYTVAKRSYDARKRGAIVLIYSVDVETPREAEILQRLETDVGVPAHWRDEDAGAAHSHMSSSGKTSANQSTSRNLAPTPDTSYKFVAHAPDNLAQRPIVIGTGPCGLFAGLILAQMGFRPIILDRGKQVRERTVDTFGLWRKNVLNPESNVQFGEGGAGTFSDGKLYSQIRDPLHHGRKVLTEFVKAGAPEEILYVSKPHIGTFRLVTMVESMRASIEALGGEIRFGQRVDDLLVDRSVSGQGHVRGVTLASGEQLRADQVVLAVGHSARDTFAMLHARGVFV
ncbi:MAG TPA: FAD-dependent oxidoreductase, partial [Xanthomonadaceae bacterium]|nr:FAD-dependent oxidoreductase [Xanthomonadaceae bacterium]